MEKFIQKATELWFNFEQVAIIDLGEIKTLEELEEQLSEVIDLSNISGTTVLTREAFETNVANARQTTAIMEMIACELNYEKLNIELENVLKLMLKSDLYRSVYKQIHEHIISKEETFNKDLAEIYLDLCENPEQHASYVANIVKNFLKEFEQLKNYKEYYQFPLELYIGSLGKIPKKIRIYGEFNKTDVMLFLVFRTILNALSHNI